MVYMTCDRPPRIMTEILLHPDWPDTVEVRVTMFARDVQDDVQHIDSQFGSIRTIDIRCDLPPMIDAVTKSGGEVAYVVVMDDEYSYSFKHTKNGTYVSHEMKKANRSSAAV